MLAEKKYKKKWSVDPQNVTWARDQNKFGFKMLQKMGWTDGKGLGAGEDGLVAPVKAVFKDDSRGLGCTASYDDTWVAHQDDFQSLLNNLNGNDDEKGNDASNNNLDLSSMSDNSKGQKKIHYGKFTKGKDLSNYKNEDMDAIFGIKKRKVAKGQENAPEVTDAANTKVSKLSMNEYFKQRMAQLKAGKTASKSEENSENEETESVTPPEATEDDVAKPKKKEKKSKKSKKKKETSEEDENVETPEPEEEPKLKKKDKKRKKKKEASEEPEEVEKVLKDATSENIEANPEKKSKKKRKRKAEEEIKSQTEVISTSTTNSDEEMPKKKKKKKDKKSKKNDT